MKLGKKILLLSALSIFSLVTYAADTAQPSANANVKLPDISGHYECQGYDPYGKSNYSNPVTVTRNGETYSFQWLSSKGYPFILGTGVFNKNISNAISVVFWDPKKQDYFGTEIFEIKPDGSMQATWTLQGENAVGTETCTKSTK